MTPEEKILAEADRAYNQHLQQEGFAFMMAEFDEDEDEYPSTAEEIMDEVGECDPNALL